MKNLVKAGFFIARTEAELAKGYLEANGIKSFLTGDEEGGAYPYPMSSMKSGITMFVAKKDFAKAAKLLETVK